MSIKTEIREAFPNEVIGVEVHKDAKLHGEDATMVIVGLLGGRVVQGTFTNEPRKGFGGVEFSGPKDIAGLMVAKVRSVLTGTAE